MQVRIISGCQDCHMINRLSEFETFDWFKIVMMDQTIFRLIKKNQINRAILRSCMLIEPVCYKKRQKSSWPVIGELGDIWRFWMIPNWSYMEHEWPLNHLGSIWYHSEPSDVRYSENHLRPISWFGLFLQRL